MQRELTHINIDGETPTRVFCGSDHNLGWKTSTNIDIDLEGCG